MKDQGFLPLENMEPMEEYEDEFLEEYDEELYEILKMNLKNKKLLGKYDTLYVAS